MPMMEMMVAELDNDAAATRRLLDRVPFDDPEFKPHEKSMTLQRLAGHVAEIPMWAHQILEEDELDFAADSDRTPFLPTSRDELLAKHDEAVAAFKQIAAGIDDARLMEPWTLRQGEQVLMTLPRGVVARNWILNHAIHHRAQLTVYLRLLDVPLPAIYGNSADENPFS